MFSSRADRPDVVIETDAATLRAVVFGDRRLDDTLRSGDLKLAGDRYVADRFLALFARPAPLVL